MVCPLRGRTSPLPTRSSVCESSHPDAMIYMDLSVPRPMQSPGLAGRRKPKSLLHVRSAKVFAVLGVTATTLNRLCVTRGGGVETNHFDRRWRRAGVGRLRRLHQGRHRPALSRCAAGSFTRDGPESLGLSTNRTETDDHQGWDVSCSPQSDCAPTWTGAPRQQRPDRPNGHSPLTAPSIDSGAG